MYPHKQSIIVYKQYIFGVKFSTNNLLLIIYKYIKFVHKNLYYFFKNMLYLGLSSDHFLLICERNEIDQKYIIYLQLLFQIHFICYFFRVIN